MSWGEQEIQQFCARLLAGGAEPVDELELARDAALRAEVEDRLASCGVRLWRTEGQAPLCLLEDEAELSNHSRAALAYCALRLHPRLGSQSGRRPRVEIEDLRGALRGNYSAAYLRRAVLGPLVRRQLLRVVKPDQRASDAYIVAGPLLAALDIEALQSRLPDAA